LPNRSNLGVLSLVAALLALRGRAGRRLAPGLEALTDLPLQAGGRVWAEAPYGIHLDTSLGVLPRTTSRS